MVGDIKQSIYGFRQCERVFLRKTERFKATGEGNVVYMNDNFVTCGYTRLCQHGLGVMTYEFGTADYAADCSAEGDESIDGVCPVILNCVTEEKPL
ncbi:MAG: hypothetical protein ACLTSK_00180 [Christensenellales bacterium]